MSLPVGYKHERRYRSRTLVRRRLVDFPSPTLLESPCRLWQGSLTRSGYALICDGRRVMQVSRYLMEMVHGPLRSDQVVMHRCDQPLCFRFDHLVLGTSAMNSRDMMAKGRGRGQFPVGLNRKLSTEDVAEIRTRYAAGETQSQLARAFNVHRTTTLRIVTHAIRAHS